MYGSTTERQRQKSVAEMFGKGLWYVYLVDGREVAVYAMTEPGAARVVNAEHPGLHFQHVRTEREATLEECR